MISRLNIHSDDKCVKCIPRIIHVAAGFDKGLKICDTPIIQMTIEIKAGFIY